MTCIVGVLEQGKAWLGGDSAGVSGWDLTVRADPKVFRVGPFVIGFTDSFRMGQLLRFHLAPPQQPEGMDTFEFMATHFVDAVRDCLKAGGYATKQNDQESGGTFLVGYAGRLFRIDRDYQVGEAIDGFDAVGAGFQVARGALFATAGRAPEERIRVALEAAERFSAAVRGPFAIEST